MPCLKIVTNLARSAVPPNFVTNMLPVLARSIGKPEDRFTVSVVTDSIVSVGNEGLGVVASIESIGHLGPEQNKNIARDLSHYIALSLDLDKDRIFISFYDLAAHNVARNGVTIG